jgi:hypothetical protein
MIEKQFDIRGVLQLIEKGIVECSPINGIDSLVLNVSLDLHENKSKANAMQVICLPGHERHRPVQPPTDPRGLGRGSSVHA